MSAKCGNCNASTPISSIFNHCSIDKLRGKFEQMVDASRLGI